MTVNGWIQILLFIAIIVALTRPLGGYLDRVTEGQRTLLSPVLGPIERGFYRLCGINPSENQSWWVYCGGMLLFHLFGFALLYGLQRLQGILPFNPQDMSAVAPDLEKPIFHVSGPEPFVDALGGMLSGLRVPDTHVRRDYFPGYDWPAA